MQTICIIIVRLGITYLGTLKEIIFLLSYYHGTYIHVFPAAHSSISEFLVDYIYIDLFSHLACTQLCENISYRIKFIPPLTTCSSLSCHSKWRVWKTLQLMNICCSIVVTAHNSIVTVLWQHTLQHCQFCNGPQHKDRSRSACRWMITVEHSLQCCSSNVYRYTPERPPRHTPNY